MLLTPSLAAMKGLMVLVSSARLCNAISEVCCDNICLSGMHGARLCLRTVRETDLF